MLILARKPRQTIRISDDIAVTVMNIYGNVVHIGVDAPRYIEVHREEVFNQIQLQRQLAQNNLLSVRQQFNKFK
ncbi:MAG: carbon storage regulator CsrA [Gammaproteobacteria bacterium]